MQLVEDRRAQVLSFSASITARLKLSSAPDYLLARKRVPMHTPCVSTLAIWSR
jgi:hypothetical protein